MTNKVLFVTSNAGKAAEAAWTLHRHGLEVEQVRLDLVEPRVDDLHDVAGAKAAAAVKSVGKAVVVEDTGFFLQAYEGFPGSCSKFVISRIGREGILRLVEGKSRMAHFRTVVAYCEPWGAPVFFDGRADGRVVNSEQGESDPSLPYDPIFAPAGSQKTYGQMPLADKLADSSRFRAFNAFGEWFVKNKLAVSN
jgi:XTP/dITP diphosphohydrolase